MPDTTEDANVIPRPSPSLGWVLRRALFGLALVVTVSVAAAWLTAAGLDPAQIQESE